MKHKFKEYGIYNILYYDDKYWSEYLNFDTKQELDKCKIRPKIKQELYEYLLKTNLPKIIVSTTTNLFIEYELGENIKDFEKIYSCVDYFKVGGKTQKVYEEIAEELEIKPNEILHIGDNVTMDIENAKKAGVNTILYSDDIEDLIYNIEKYINE